MVPRVQGSPMKLHLNTHAQYDNIDLCAETKSKKCASDKNSPPVEFFEMCIDFGTVQVVHFESS